MGCIYCGAGLEPGATHCGQCGHAVGQKRPPVTRAVVSGGAGLNGAAAPLPAAAFSSSPRPAEAPGASQGKRFCNYLIDLVTCIVIATVLAVIVGLAAGFTAVAMGASQAVFEEGSSLMQAINVVEIVIRILTIVCYYTILEYATGRTLGKLVTGTKAVAADGGRVGFWQVFGRSWARLIPFEPFSFLGKGAAPLGWHDNLSHTRVIDLRKAGA